MILIEDSTGAKWAVDSDDPSAELCRTLVRFGIPAEEIVLPPGALKGKLLQASDLGEPPTDADDLLRWIKLWTCMKALDVL